MSWFTRESSYSVVMSWHEFTVQAQNVNCEQRSEQLESSESEKSDLREVIHKSSTKTNQVVQDEEHIKNVKR